MYFNKKHSSECKENIQIPDRHLKLVPVNVCIYIVMLSLIRIENVE
jgi:hypothetical protein